MKFTVNEPQELFTFLQTILPDCTKTTLRSLLAQKRVLLNNKLVTVAKTAVNPGQVVEITPKVKKVEGRVKIIYQDRHFIVIDKPAGLLSVSTDFEKEDTAHTLLKKMFYPKKVFVVHRLDQDTSGTMLFALSEKGVDSLKILFEKHDITRKYLAVTEGVMKEDNGTFQSYLFEDENYMVRSTNNREKGELAITHFKRISHNEQYSLVELTLETGKKNQIRVHLKDAGHPVAGDKKYGARDPLAKRLMLHAKLLSFAHPVTGKQMIFESPVPKFFFSMTRVKDA